MELHDLKDARQKGTVQPFLENFIQASSSKADFSSVDYFVRQELVSLIEEEVAKEPWSSSWANVFANLIRLLSRDENNVDVIFTSETVKNYILALARLPEDSKHPTDQFVEIEAIKCLVNALYKSTEMRNYFGNKSHEALRNQLKALAGKTAFTPEEATKYNLLLRISFISTALQVEKRAIWTQDDYFPVLLTILEQSLSLAMIGNQTVIEDLKLRVSEVLKTFFNLFCKSDPTPEKTVATLQLARKILFSKLATDLELCQNCVNLIFTLPVTLEVICPPMKDVRKSTAQYEGRDMSVMKILLEKMEERIDQNETELLTMYLTAIHRYCVVCPEARRYIRLIILPPLKDVDVERHPDEGNSLRNKLIRIMKTVGNAGTVASELMFVLCKRSVARMIKYTGFGHSAGLLANAGLLGQVNMPKSSADSEDSETEEYAAVEDKVNPVTGCIRPQNVVNPLDGMTEEQKEYEADKLMKQLNEMLDSGLVKPAMIGDDGKARPLKHVLELMKDAPEKASDTDSD